MICRTVFAVTLLGASQVLAQETFTEITFNSLQGQLETTFLPYAEKFIIKGSTSFATGEADIVHVAIKDEPDGKLLETVMWTRPQGNTASEFSVIMPLLTSIGNEYEFTFTFLKRATFDTQMLNTVIDATMRRIQQHITANRSISTSQADAILTQEVNTQLLSLPGASDFRFVAGLSVQTGLPTYRFSEGNTTVLTRLSQAATTLVQLGGEQAQLAAAQTALTAALSGGNFGNLTTEMQQAGLLAEDINVLRAAVTAPTEAPTDLFDRFTIVINSATRPTQVSDASAALLITVLTQIDLIRSASTTIEEANLNFAAAQVSEQQLRNAIGEFFIEQSKATLDDVVWPGKAKLEELRIGTGYGFAATYLNPLDDYKEEALSYIALKIHFGPVDKSLPDIYAYPQKIKSRLAVTIGLVFDSQIFYEGQEQKDLFASMKPMLGISYDLNRYLGFNVGAMLFRQPSTNPLAAAAAERERAKMAPYFGILFDFNVINRLNTLVTSN